MKRHVAIMTAAVLGACLLTACVTTWDVGAGERIDDAEFRDWGLTDVTIGEGAVIKSAAFAGNRLTSLTVPKGVTIGGSAFAGNQISSLTLSEGVSIGYRAFEGNQLSSLTIPEGVSIGEKAFAGNPLTRIVFEGAVADCYVSSFDVANAEVGIAVMNGQTPGIYTKEGDAWLFNGVPLPRPVKLVTDYGVYAERIDGATPLKFFAENRERRICLVPAGWHTVKVRYSATDGSTRTYSEDAVIFEHRYLFEGSDYVFTGEVEGNQIVFRIVPR
ncbi:MAG: leucine-rich repeat domain-containing protein [Treponema sp.]|jgi:predicted small secreted protein|nr:leucine-rich repeat domain-containing protein [Treponema sp.]